MWAPWYDVVDMSSIIFALKDNAMLYETYAFFDLFFGNFGKISKFYNYGNSSNPFGNPNFTIPTDMTGYQNFINAI